MFPIFIRILSHIFVEKTRVFATWCEAQRGCTPVCGFHEKPRTCQRIGPGGDRGGDWIVSQKTPKQLWTNYGTIMDKIWKHYGKNMEKLWNEYGKNMENIWKKYGTIMEKLWTKLWNNNGKLWTHYGNYGNKLRILLLKIVGLKPTQMSSFFFFFMGIYESNWIYWENIQPGPWGLHPLRKTLL